MKCPCLISIIYCKYKFRFDHYLEQMFIEIYNKKPISLWEENVCVTVNVYFNNVSANYASAKVTISNPLNMHFRKNPYIYQMIDHWYLPLENNILQENNNSHRIIFLQEILKNLYVFLNILQELCFLQKKSITCRNLCQRDNFPKRN